MTPARRNRNGSDDSGEGASLAARGTDAVAVGGARWRVRRRISASVRDKLWERACGTMAGGAGMLIHNADNEQGFSVRFWGGTNRWVVDYEGLTLIRVPEGRKRQGFPHARGDGPKSRERTQTFTSFPHARGDGPKAIASRPNCFRFSPRAWGWSERTRMQKLLRWVRFPHARGDGPKAVAHHMRMCAEVFPTRVGMVR